MSVAVSSSPGSAGPRWILSARQDLLWLHGSVLAGLGLLALLHALPAFDAETYRAGHPAVLVLFLWGVLFDATHVWGTYARSYLAPDAASRQGLPGPWSWGLVALGPAVALVDHAAFEPGASQLGSAGPLFRAFLLGAYLWAYWHLVRQHYGFLALYQKRAGVSRAAARWEERILWAGCLYPFLRFSTGEAFLRSGLPVLLPEGGAAAARLVLDVGFLAVVVWGVRRAGRALATGGRPHPGHLLMGLVVAFHLLVFGLLEDLLAITATLTIFHNPQYHRIVWQYERGKGRDPSGGLVPYLLLGIGLGLVWYGPRVLGAALAPAGVWRNVLLGFGWGVAFHHYLVDGRIWKVRSREDVSRALDSAREGA